MAEVVDFVSRRLLDKQCRELIGIEEPEAKLTADHLRPYQRFMSSKARNQRGVLLAAEMGLGKTGASLHACVQMLKSGKISRILVVAPLFVAENTWPEAIGEWKFCEDLTFVVCTGTAEERREALSHPVDLVIVNRENLVWLVEHFHGLFPFDCLIYDEASRLKGGRDKTKPTIRKDGTQSKPNISEFGALKQVRHWFKRIILLTGTPAPNGLVDLWGPAFIIDGGDRLGRTREDFLATWFNVDQYTHAIEPRAGAFEAIMSRLPELMYAMRAEDYLELPEMIVGETWVNMQPKALATYKRLEKEMALEESNIEAVNRGVLHGKLCQLANGSVYDSQKGEVEFHSEKIPALESIIREAEGASVLVAYSYQFDMPRLRKRWPKIRLFGEGKNDYQDWNKGRIPLMMAHPASVGHGLNFQKGGHISCWYGIPSSLELYQQFNARLRRSGQESDHVYLHHILTRGTVDGKVFAALQDKGATQSTITDAFRAHMKEVAAA